MKHSIRKIILPVLFLMLQPLGAQTVIDQGVDLKNAGQSTMNFLQVGVVPKAIALGEAYSAIGQGVESMFYNPAGLAEMDHKADFFLSTTNWIADIQYFGGAVGLRLGNFGTLGLTLVAVDYGELIGTSLVSGSDISTDELGYVETGPISNVGAYAIGLGYSRRVSNEFLFGGSVRFADQNLGQSVLSDGLKDNSESKIVFDLGVKYYTPIQGFRFGMSIRNFGQSVKYEEITAALPLTFSVGGAVELLEMFQSDPQQERKSSLLATAEFSHPNNYTERLHMGMEYSFKGFFSGRVGYITNHDIAGLSFGIGLVPEFGGTALELNYTYSQMDVFDDVNRFSAKFSF